MAKSLVNNLLGRFGIKVDKPVTKIVSLKTFNSISTRNVVTCYKTITSDSILVSYIPKLDANVIASHKLDIVKLASKYKDEEKVGFDASSIPISAAITCYGRIHINKLKIFIMKNGGTIYYSDTDSIITDIKLPQ